MCQTSIAPSTTRLHAGIFKQISFFAFITVFIAGMPGKTPAQNIGGGVFHSLAIKSDGSVVAWGMNDNGQCDVPTPNSGFVVIAAGGYHSIGLKSDGSLVAWGMNDKGQCDVPTPNSGFVAIAGGGYHSLGLKSDGSVVAWGNNTYGQCNIPAPNSGFVAIAAGTYHSVGLKSDGSVVAWGRNNNGQCDVPTPNSGFTAISAIYFHSLGLKSDRSVVAWGGRSALYTIPTLNSGFVAIADNTFCSLGLKSDASLVGWGDDSSGYGLLTIPTSTDFVAIASGSYHFLGLKSDGSVEGWGNNIEKQCTAQTGISTIPNAPIAMAANVLSANYAVLNWIPSVNATSFRIDISSYADFSTCDLLDNYLLSSGSPSHLSLGIGGAYKPGKLYYRVRAVNASGTSPNSVSITVDFTSSILSASYDATSGLMVLTCNGLTAGDNIDCSKLTITGEGGDSYSLTTTGITAASGTKVSITLNDADRKYINQIINKNGTTSTGGTVYNLAAANGWDASITSGDLSDLETTVTASNVPVPAITGATYDCSTGVLAVTGTGFVKYTGINNDIDLSKITITGNAGASIILSGGTEITDGTAFSVTLTGASKAALDVLLNKNGTTSTSGTLYNIAAASGWAAGTTVTDADATGNGITVSNAMPVYVTASDGTSSFYNTLKTAFDAINAGTHTGNIVIEINGNVTETASAVLNASLSGSANYSSVNIYPTDANVTISGNLASPLIDFNGANNVTINGSVGGTGSSKSLTITNTSNSGTAGTSTIRFINGASYNTIKYCTIKGSSLDASAGILFFSSATGITGNIGNTIANNNISNASNANRPVNAIYSLGTLAKDNSSDQIIDNEIFDFFNRGTNSFGINLSAYTSAWTISGNSFYETTSFASTSGVYNVIAINNTSGNNFTVSGNKIGGSAANCAGTWINNNSNSPFIVINIKAGNTVASNIQGNIIQNINYSNYGAAGFIGIFANYGLINIGTTKPNIIGSATGTGSIKYTCSASGACFYGIYVSSASTDIQNNIIGSITVDNTNPGYSSSFYGVFDQTSGTFNFQNNTIGSSSTPNSIQANSPSTSADQSVFGICCLNGNASVTNNIISNMSNASTYTTAKTNGIYSPYQSKKIANNIISNLSCAGGSGVGVNASVVGINIYGGIYYNHMITQNVISNLSNSGTATDIIGIAYTGSTTCNVIVDRNFVSSFSSTATAPVFTGIYCSGGTGSYNNNIVNLSPNEGLAAINGIYDNGGTNSICHNTIYIGGAGTGTTSALSSIGTNVRNYRNNIFANTRTGGTANALNIANPASLTIGYNNYMGSLAGITLNTTPDNHSITVIPNFVDAVAGDLHLTTTGNEAFIATGINVGVTTDYDGITRNDPPCIGAYELIAPVINISAALTSFSSTYGSASAAQTYTVKAYFLTADLTITAPSEFEVSANGTDYSNSLALTPVSRTVNTTVYVRTSASAIVGNTLGNITHTSTNAVQKDVAVSCIIGQKELTITGITPQNKPYDGNTTITFSGTPALSGVLPGDIGNVTLTYSPATGTVNNANAGTGKTVSFSGYTMSGAASGYYYLTQPTYTADILAETLTINADNINKEYGSTITGSSASTAFTSIGLAGTETIGSVSIAYGAGAGATDAVGTYTGSVTPSAATGGTFDAGNYNITYTSGNITIGLKELTITGATANNKIYDGNKNASISGATLVGVAGSDDVSLDALTGTFDNANVGNTKFVTSAITIKGTATSNYTLTQPTGLTADITAKQLTITNPVVVTNKMYDGTTSATITTLGTLQGIESSDVGSVSVLASANFNDASVGTGKTISVTYSLTGSAVANYLAPVAIVMNDAIIYETITLSTLQTPAAGCEGSSLILTYTVVTGTPTQYRITFDANAQAAGFDNIGFTALPGGDIITINIPAGTPNGTYHATLQMQNAIGIASAEYNFAITVNLSSSIIIAKFNDVVLCDNSSNRFVAYQWYKDGGTISGATGQFYNDKEGLSGAYSLQVTTTSGEILKTCPVKFSNTTLLVAASLRVYPNPVNIGQNITVTIEGFSDEDLCGAALTVSNSQGMIVYQSDKVTAMNTFILKNTGGTHVIHLVTSEGRELTSKLILIK